MEKPKELQPIEYLNTPEQRANIKYNGTGWAYNNSVIKWFYIEKEE